MAAVMVLLLAFGSGLAAGQGKAAISVTAGVFAVAFAVAWEWTTGTRDDGGPF